MSNYILVTGGIGFLGSHLIPRLKQTHQKIVIIDNEFSRQNIFGNDINVIFVKCDIRDDKQVAKLFTTFNFSDIFHLAAHHFIPYCNNNVGETIDVNLMGTINILKHCNQGVTFHFCSTAAVYKISNDSHNESESPNPTDIYGLTKYHAENYLKYYSNRYKFKAIIYRIFNLVGPNETNPHLIPEIINQLKYSKTLKLGNLSTYRSYLDVRDCADAMIGIYKKQELVKENLNIFNISGEILYSGEDIIRIFEDIIVSKIIVTHDPQKMRPSDRTYLNGNIDKIHRLTGWKPKINLTKSISDAIKSSN